MKKPTYSKRRRIIQLISLFVLLSIPLRLFCFDADDGVLRVFGKNLGLAEMFYPFFSIILLLMLVFYLSMKKGRIFCSHMCPMHGFLEIVNRPAMRDNSKRFPSVIIWGTIFSLFLMEVILSFLIPISKQWTLIMEGNLPLIGIMLALTAGFLGLFISYQETFCKKGCPYALIQQLLQSDQTRTMKFANPEKTCTNCRKCDTICPMNLRPRFESAGFDCTNCNLCADACTTELGENNTLFELIDPVTELPPEKN